MASEVAKAEVLIKAFNSAHLKEYGFVTMKNAASVEKARRELHRSWLEGRHLKVSGTRLTVFLCFVCFFHFHLNNVLLLATVV